MTGKPNPRLERIEARLRAIEGALDREGIARHGPAVAQARRQAVRSPAAADAPRQPAAVPLPPPLPVPGREAPGASRPGAPHPAAPAPTPRTPLPEHQPVDWERFFGLAVLGRVGVAAVLLAAGYFAQLAYREMSDAGKVIAIYGLAAAFVGVGFALRPRVASRYVALLWGGGAAAAYLAGAVARLRYGLVGDPVGLVMLFGASGLGQFLARRLKHETLASIALAGAFAAPLLTESTLDQPTFVLVYLLALHTWSAWVERRWSWHSARAVGVGGTLLIAATWLVRHGAVDTSTFLHIHLYMLGLAAPELHRVASGQRISQGRQLALPLVVGLAEAGVLIAMLAAGSRGGIPLPSTTFSAGIVWTLAALLLAARARPAHNHPLIRGLALVGGLLLAIGALIGVQALPVDFFVHQRVVAVVATTGVGMLALALRRRLGVGELTAYVATGLAALTAVSQEDPARAFVLFPIAAAGAAVVVVTSRTTLARCGAAWTGLVAIAAGLARGELWSLDHDWLAAGLAGGALWAAAVLEWARRRGDTALAANGSIQLCLLALLWAPLAFVGELREVGTALVNPTTLAALVLAAVAGVSAWRRQATLEARDRTLLAALWGLAVVLPLAAGHREVLAAVEALPRTARDGWHTVYLAAAAAVLAWLGRGRHALVARSAAIVAGIGVAKMLGDVQTGGATAWAAAQLGLMLLTPLGLAWLADRRDRGQVSSALFLYGGAALGWALYTVAGRFPTETALLNLRFLTGAATLVGASAFPFPRLSEGDRRPATTAYLLGGIALGFCVGLAELLDLVRELEGAWPDVLVSVYMTAYAAGTLVAGFLRRDRRLRYPALILFGVVVLKVGLLDLAAASTGLRIFVTGILGLVLLAAAFAYARRSGSPPGQAGARSRSPPAG